MGIVNDDFLDHLQSMSVKPSSLLTLSLVVVSCQLMKSSLVIQLFSVLS